MHHPLPPRIMYRNHALLHHMAFTDGHMPITRPAELGLVMMPWYTMIGIFVVTSPVIVVAGLLRGPGLAGVFLLAAVAYFLIYETLHALYHLPVATLNRLRSAVRASSGRCRRTTPTTTSWGGWPRELQRDRAADGRRARDEGARRASVSSTAPAI